MDAGAMEAGAMQAGAMDAVAQRVRVALESADVSAFNDLLDPNVHWGAPDDPRPSCQNRNQVLAWYQRGREAGVRASVTEVVVLGDRILVGLTVRGSDAAEDRGGVALRWQVLSVRAGRVVDIVAFDDRAEAVARATTPAA
jgi:ketosteroid isomerase-like protein